MDPAASSSSRTCPKTNTLTTYLRLLRQCKPTLPYGELVCVSASPNISTMSSLLRLARTVGPYIGVLQVHADIIDDWSLEGVCKLARLAKKHAFIIWEGGRVLNTHQRLSNRILTPDEVSRDIDMSRKRYTKGVVSVAAWAGLASTWMIDSPQQGNGADRLIPTLRRAAKETVAFMTKSVRTEISSSGGSMSSNEVTDETEHEYTMELDEALRVSASDGLSVSQSPRKASVISLTQTITQSTEPSTPSAIEVDDHPLSEAEDELAEEDERVPPAASLPEPPLLSRGLIISAPRDDDERFTLEYRVAAFESAKANADFVVGFFTDEPWIEICTRSLCSEAAAELSATIAARTRNPDDENEHPFKEESESTVDEERRTFLMFNPLETDHLTRFTRENDDGFGQSSTTPAPATNGENQQISGLQQLIASAVAIRNSRVSPEEGLSPGVRARYGGFDMMFVPVITMNV
ncbi:hypothetical protein H103_00477 [Trichophyton rubrum CBS 288.86]|uniref:Uncharacterized protein n=1 Tax=Trichophyton rubrum CBS 288.86 TaxID=1215330 RepID=A0A022WGQ7_TRIRU|nr:hypothetical protein H103_00477 [Trichophyton rubrum CBS 288.86]